MQRTKRIDLYIKILGPLFGVYIDYCIDVIDDCYEEINLCINCIIKMHLSTDTEMHSMQ